MHNEKLKRLLFGLLMAVLLFPLCFQPFNGTITAPLKGYQPKAKHAELKRENIVDGSWQAYAEAYTKDNLQSKHFLIRLNNQLKYSFFDHLNANGVERGRNDFYFESRYARSYLGTRFTGEEKLAKRVADLQALTDTLNQRGVQTLVVLAAGKAHFMPENIPPKYDGVEKQRNDYEIFVDYLKQSSIAYLDLQQYLVDMKDTSSYPLFTRGNIHWSFYAMSYITDTLITTIEQQLSKDLPDYQRHPVSLKYDPTYYTEGGIFKSLNLYWTEIQDTFAYRDIRAEEIIYQDKYRPKVWVIGDSFYGTMETYQVPQQFFDPSTTFFYYNSSIVQATENKNYSPGSISEYLDQIENQDLVIIWTTDAGIRDCGWGATETILKHYRQTR